jgi:hypothetical protein
MYLLYSLPVNYQNLLLVTFYVHSFCDMRDSHPKNDLFCTHVHISGILFLQLQLYAVTVHLD